MWCEYTEEHTRMHALLNTRWGRVKVWVIDEMKVLAQLAHHSPSVTKHERSDLSPIQSLIHSPVSLHTQPFTLISHFPLQSFSPLFGPIIFVCALLLLLSLCSSPFIYSIISHLHSVSFLFMLLSYLSLWNVFHPLPSLVCFCHHHVQRPAGLSLSLRNPSVSQQINCNYT